MPTSRAKSRLTCVALLLALCAVLVLHRLVLDAPSGHGFLNADLDRQYHPNAVFLHDELRSGRLPFWNPYQAAGQPFVAQHQSAALYPPNLLLLLCFAPEPALALAFALHVFVAGLFTWLFARRIGLGVPASLLAAFAFMLAPTQMHVINLPPFQATEAWLPAILWSLHGLLEEARLRWVPALAGALALAFLGGHAQGFFYELQLAIAYACFGLVLVAPRERRLRAVALGLLAGALALGLAAPQWLPALELARESSRRLGGYGASVAGAGFIPLAELLRGISPLLGRAGPMSWVVTLPVLALPLVALGLLARRQRSHWLFFGLAALLCALFMLGPGSPVWEIAQRLPLGASFRAPLRMGFVYMLCVAMLLGIGFEGVWGSTARPRAATRRLRGAITVGALLLLLFVAGDLYSRTHLYVGHPALRASPPRGAPESLVSYLRRQAGQQRVFVATPERRGEPPLLRKMGMMNQLFALPDYDPIMPRAYADYFGVDLDKPWHGDLSLVDRRGRATPMLRDLLDLMSVRYYAALARTPRRRLLPTLRAAGGEVQSLEGVELVERSEALPRAYAVTRVLREPDAAAALRRLRSDDFDRDEEVVLVAPDAEPGSRIDLVGPGGDVPTPASALAPATRILSLDSRGVELEAECESRCVLVLTDLHYPGWRVRVDGEPREILLANGIFRGVLLEPGRHRVVYDYRPRSVRLGFAWLAASLLATAGVALVVWRRGR